MKKSIIFFIVLWLLFTLVFMTACSDRGADSSDWVDILPNNLWAVTDGITMRLSQDEYLPGTTEMTLILENRSDSVMSYGNGWVFKKYINGEWRELKCIDNYGFTMEGYELCEYDKKTFPISTWFLSAPLDVGLYRVTGCNLRVAADSENLSYDGDFVDYPPYQLEFIISETAVQEPDFKQPEEELAAGELRKIEDWQWYTLGDCHTMYRNAGLSDWSNVKGKNGLVAVLYRENTPENEILNIGDKLMLDIFDRKTGKRYEVFTELKFEYNKVSAYQEGFKADCGDLFYCFIENDTAKIILLTDESSEPAISIPGEPEWKQYLKDFLFSSFPSLFDEETIKINQEIWNKWEESGGFFDNGTYVPDPDDLPTDALDGWVPNRLDPFIYPVAYKFYDLDNDGIPEVFIIYPTGFWEGYIEYVYKLIGTKFEKIRETGKYIDGEIFYKNPQNKMVAVEHLDPWIVSIKFVDINVINKEFIYSDYIDSNGNTTYNGVSYNFLEELSLRWDSVEDIDRGLTLIPEFDCSDIIDSINLEN